MPLPWTISIFTPTPSSHFGLFEEAGKNLTQPSYWLSGDIYEQAFVKTFAGFFTGIPNIYSASPDFGAPLDYVRAGSSHLNEVEPPQSPRTESGLVFPPIVT